MIVMISTLQGLLKKEIENIILCKCVFPAPPLVLATCTNLV